MDEKKRIEDIKSGLKKNVYEQAAKIKVDNLDKEESTERLSNILDGYVERIDTIEADNLGELEEELRVLKQENVEVGSMGEKDLLVKQYNDYIHNDLDRTIAETVEYTYNLNNKTDDLNDILIRPMEGEDLELKVNSVKREEPPVLPEPQPDTDELFEIEATTDLGVYEDIVELEEDTLDIEGPEEEKLDLEDEQALTTNDDSETAAVVEGKESVDKEDTSKEKKTEDKKAKKKKAKKTKKDKSQEIGIGDEDLGDDKGLAAFDYVLIIILIAIFLVLIGLVAKINGVF